MMKRMNKKTILVSVTILVGLTSTLRADQVVLDDMIINGSGCVGNDCVNGESFGFNTLRLKENNLRIAFIDTSSSASFPTADWVLVANDSANGGDNYVAFEDLNAGTVPFKVVAGAPSNSLMVDENGKLGLGTNTPAVEIHSVDGDTPTLRLEQDGRMGWPSQVWDVAGNETNFFVRDVSNGSRLPFRIRAEAPSNSLYVNNNGYIGMGTQLPLGHLHVADAGAVSLVLEDSTNSSKWTVQAGGAGNTLSLSAEGGQAVVIDSAGNLEVPGNVVSTNIPEDATPDFVFGADYELMPIASLEKYIEKEAHLPGIPSAAEVSASGLNHVEFQLGLLEKVEQLALYTIAQEKRIAELTAENRAMSTRLSKMSERIEQVISREP